MLIKGGRKILEIKVTIEAPELSNAISNLATALSGRRELSTPAFTDEINAKKGFKQPENPVPVTPPQVPVQQSATPDIPVQPLTVPTAPVQQIAAPTPTVPVAPPQQYTLEQIMQAGAALMDANKMNELSGLLHTFGVAALTQLKPEQFGAFATALRGLGAKI